MVRVHLNGELVVEVSHLLPERWNGWAVPVFTEEQMHEINEDLRWLGYVGEGETPEGWEDLGNGEWITNGWVWEADFGSAI